MRKLGVMLVAFDIPVQTKEQRRKSALFRRNLIKSGYMMMQESVYVKLMRVGSGYSGELSKLDDLAPDEGKVMAFPLSLETFRSAISLRGNLFDIGLFSDDVVCLESDAS